MTSKRKQIATKRAEGDQYCLSFGTGASLVARSTAASEGACSAKEAQSRAKQRLKDANDGLVVADKNWVPPVRPAAGESLGAYERELALWDKRVEIQKQLKGGGCYACIRDYGQRAKDGDAANLAQICAYCQCDNAHYEDICKAIERHRSSNGATPYPMLCSAHCTRPGCKNTRKTLQQ